MARITDDPSADVDPSWPPGGQELVFAAKRDEGFDPYPTPQTGGQAARTTVSSGDNTQPSASVRSGG